MLLNKVNIMNKTRTNLLHIFNAAIDAVGGESAVTREFETQPLEKHTLYPEQFHIVAIGKAADAMLQGVIAIESATKQKIKTALLISKHGHIQEQTKKDPRITCLESDHPLPQQATMKAGLALIDYLSHLPKGDTCIFLISGGASSLVEVLHEGWDLAQLQELTDYLLANGYNINQMNAIRRRVSKIKGGGLWNYIDNRPVHCLMISDVPGDNPADIGSGLLFPVDDIDLPDIPTAFIDKIPPFRQNTQAEAFTFKIIASLETAKKAAAKKAIELGYSVELQNEFLDGEATEVAKTCVSKSLEKTDTLCIWGGETMVFLPENPGAGGRNQHLALSAAIAIKAKTNTTLLAAGTDGSDGISDATGAIIDNGTIIKGTNKGLDAMAYLKASDSNTFLSATGDTIVTGSTGTNVMDLVFAITET